jgi:hypothetical protein
MQAHELKQLIEESGKDLSAPVWIPATRCGPWKTRT